MSSCISLLILLFGIKVNVLLNLKWTYLFPGQTQVDPPQPVVVMVGDDTVLPCQLEPAMDAFKMTMEWGRLDLDPRFIYVWHDGKALLDDQNTAYEGRTSLAIDKLKHGDISLKLSKVKVSDHGTYRCYIPKQSKQYFVELLVGECLTLRDLNMLHKDSGRVVLQCESKGWHPEPEVLWLDGEGKFLSAGPTETVRGPDDLYTVSSRVTVEKRHSNNFTCRLHFTLDFYEYSVLCSFISDDFFMATSNCAASISFSVVFCLMLIIAVSFSVWRQNKITEKEVEETEQEVKSVEKGVTEKEGDKTANKANGYLKLMEIITEGNSKGEERKKAFQELQMTTSNLMMITSEQIKRIAEKNKLEDYMEEIEQQLQEKGTETGDAGGIKQDKTNPMK
uniref:Ig-like domain-containing protein n=1 Tax=Seriola dumerili TaxID=41447 RepID=A0A3B4UBU4_SERDU